MSDSESNRRQFLWHFRPNIPNIQDQVRDNRIPHHVGQVFRNVIPGTRPQPQYHPNPYLPHLYRDVTSGNNNGEEAARDELIDAFEAQLQEVITEDVAATGPGEGHNHTHSHNTPQRRQIENVDWKVLLSSASFVLILFLRLMADHFLGLVMLVDMSAVFYYANMKMVEIVHLTSLRERPQTGRVFLTSVGLVFFLVANIVCIYWLFNYQSLWKVLYFQLPDGWQGDIFDLFWVTIITDHLIRYMVILLKIALALAPEICIKQKKKGKYYMFTETICQLYRTVIPIVPWIHFLYDQPRSGKLVFAAVLVVIYIILKFWCLFMEYFKVRKAVKLLMTDKKYGVQPSEEDIKLLGEGCPICQDDFQDPVMLACKHIFCENCVSIWFDREKTCPMCRAQIQEDGPVWQDGSTSGHLQWY